MEIEKLTRKGIYNLGDWFPGIPLKEQKHLRAIWNGEKKRPPRKGEWYFSGSHIAAYRAPNDFTDNMSYYIAQIVKVRIETKVVIEEVLTGKEKP